ncbi:unnamed protein product [Lactuca saligna]|uniref:Transposase MuDR plant domain-containing protein n=1 Tax=Lactuca saligna TaxID=75948 RepID=A0AA35VQI3_LACSI|nr:unnamed protein product [Lactuca saligna]
MASSDDVFKELFASIYEPFSGLNEMDYELHGIYMDHEPEHEFVTTLDKCRDIFLNVLLSDENLRNSSMVDEIRAQVYHDNEWQSDEEGEQEAVKNKYIIHDLNTPWDKMEPKVGDMFESPAQLMYCIQNYGVSNGYQIYFEKYDKTKIVARCGKRTEMNDCPFRLYAGWMYNEKSFQVKNLVGEHRCSKKFKYGSLVSPEWIGRHYIIEIANTSKMKLRDMIANIKQRLRCVVSIGQVCRAKKWATELIEGKLTEHYARVWDYADELLRSNPGSTCKVSITINPDGKNYFQKFYIGFKALSDGWKLRC